MPSASGAARFSDVRSAPGRGPPAASTASITRCPDVNSYTPGRRTHPATSTKIGTGLGVGDAAGGPAGEPNPAGAAVACTATGFGNERVYQSPTPPSVTTTTTPSPINSLRESDDRRSPIDMPANLRVRGRTNSDERHIRPEIGG